MKSNRKYNLRVYGILVHDGKVLVTDEKRGGFPMTKFPGGGLEFGEGLTACLAREFMEELSIRVEVGALFYVNEFYQESRFNPLDQLISFYYWVETSEIAKIETVEKWEELSEDGQVFRWIKQEELNETEFTFPIDREVVKRLKKEIGK